MTNSFIDYRTTDIFLILGANPAEAHPMAMRHIGKALARGAKMIVVDPRFTKTAAKAHLYVPIRPGTDIAFLYGLINYAIENNLYQHEYVLNYTNASYLISPDYYFADGVFSGLETKYGKPYYNNASWAYQRDGDVIKKDPTLQDPQCVWQIMKKHVSRYDIKTVSNVTGTPEDILQKAYAMYCESGKPNVAGNMITYRNHPAQLRNPNHGQPPWYSSCWAISLPGGGLNPSEGQSNVQGACDMGMLWNNITGYGFPGRQNIHLKDYLEVETPRSGYWSNKPKFGQPAQSLDGDKATPENDFAMTGCPSQTGKIIHMSSYASLAEGHIKGVFCWAENPSVAGPDAIQRPRPWKMRNGWSALTYSKTKQLPSGSALSKPGGYKNRSFSVAGSSQVRSGGYEAN